MLSAPPREFKNDRLSPGGGHATLLRSVAKRWVNAMADQNSVVFLLDVDNTLLDNDRVAADLKRHLTKGLGVDRQERYWTIFEELRKQVGYADYLGALQRYRAEHPREPNFLQVSFYLLNYHFANRLYPGSLDVIEHLGKWGATVILSDGDVVFQPRKVERSGLYEAVDG